MNALALAMQVSWCSGKGRVHMHQSTCCKTAGNHHAVSIAVRISTEREIAIKFSLSY